MNRLSTKYERRNHEESGINSHLYDASLRTLSDPATTTLVLVSRPERGALAEANRTRAELAEMGVLNQHLILNGMFVAQDRDDSAACALEACGKASLDGMPPELAKLPSSQVPLLPFAPMGVGNLRQVFGPGTPVCSANGRHRYQSAESDLSLSSLIDGIESAGRGVVLTMGKGGVGKTTIASAIATELARRGHAVHLSTTEAARLQDDLKRAGITPFRAARQLFHGNPLSQLGLIYCCAWLPVRAHFLFAKR